jgi:hypothetical protein
MKRLIAAVSFAVLATPVLADNKPYEQLDVDRVLPTFTVNQPERVASAGNTRSDVEISTEANRAEPVAAESPWADDHNFIAPAQ